MRDDPSADLSSRPAMPHADREVGARFQKLLEIMAALRAPETGCPWTRAQSFETIAPYTIEEAYEVVDAIRTGSMEELQDELGDLLLQVIYHARMAEEIGAFATADVIATLTAKLVRRHPHVFADASAADSETVMRNWERIKAEERPRRRADKSVLDGVPRSVPALVRARKLLEVAEGAGLVRQSSTGECANDVAGHADRLVSGMAELPDKRRTIGDALFSLARLSRAYEIDPEAALDEASTRFRERMAAREQAQKNAGKRSADAPSDARDPV